MNQFLIIRSISKVSISHLKWVVVSYNSTLSVLTGVFNALMECRGDNLIFMQPWLPDEGVISSIYINDIKKCLIFYVAKLSSQPNKAEKTLFVLIETLNNQSTRLKLR